MSLDPLPDLPASSRPMQEAMATRLRGLFGGVLGFYIESSDFNAYQVGQTQIVQNSAATGISPVGSAASGPLKVTGGVNDRVANIIILNGPPEIGELAVVEFMVTNADRTQSLHCYAENVDISDVVNGDALSATHLGGVEDSTGTNLVLGSDGWVRCTDVPGHYFARVTIQLPILA